MTRWELDGRLLDALDGLGAAYERVDAAAYVVTLTGTAGRSTPVWLLGGERSVAVEAFVVHVLPEACPDPAPLHRHLLHRNVELRRVHYAVDEVGDVFLVGSLPLAALSADAVAAVLGEVLAVLERDGDALLRLAYGDRLATDEALAAKVLADGAGRRPAGTPVRAPRRDVRR